jgi:hypothetical protein
MTLAILVVFIAITIAIVKRITRSVRIKRFFSRSSTDEKIISRLSSDSSTWSYAQVELMESGDYLSITAAMLMATDEDDAVTAWFSSYAIAYDPQSHVDEVKELRRSPFESLKTMFGILKGMGYTAEDIAKTYRD